MNLQSGVQYGGNSSEAEAILRPKSQFCPRPESATSSRILNRVVNIKNGFDSDGLKDAKRSQIIPKSRAR